MTLYVPIDAPTRARLVEMARRERRSPREQAAWLLERVLLRDVAEQSADGGARAPGGERAA
jgi:hypothetical protein